MQNQAKAERQFTRLFKQALEHQINGSGAKAQHFYNRALKVQKNSACYVNLGMIAYSKGNVDRAMKLYRDAIAIDPECNVAFNNIGTIHSERGEADKAIEAWANSLRIKPTPNTLANIADQYAKDERYQEAMAFLARALDMDENHPQALTNLAMVAWAQNDFQTALNAARKAIECGADQKTRVNLGILLLTLGEYAEGWQEYAWRFSANGVMMRGPENMPIWKGIKHVPGTLYVWPEQGLGDEILYFGAMQEVAKRADRVIWECEPRLVPLFQRGAPENVECVGTLAAPPEATAQIPAGCLAQMFHPHTPRAAYLNPDKERAAAYRAMMPPDKRIVGISWHSSNSVFGHKKSLSIEDFSAFTDDPDCYCVSLQYGDHDHGPLHLIPDLDLTRDIDGVAALISACDVVVTASNTVAHLAGALGVPCVVMVSSAGGKLWYWGTENNTIWYQSIRIQRFERDNQPIHVV